MGGWGRPRRCSFKGPPLVRVATECLHSLRAMARPPAVFVHLRPPTQTTPWRLGVHHTLALVAYCAREWGAVAHCHFPRAPGYGRLLGYGTITFQDEQSSARILHAAHERHGVLRIPYAALPEDPEPIAYTSLEEARRAYNTTRSLRDTVKETAPLASSVRHSDRQDHFLVKVERQARPPRTLPRPSPRGLLATWGGFGGTMAP